MASLITAWDTHCFYTVTSGNSVGASRIADRNGRKKRDEPFNPFAPNASAQRNKRQTERKSVERRPAPTRSTTPQVDANSGMTELAKKQKEAMERMKRQQGGVSKPTTSKPEPKKETFAPTMTTSVAKPAAPKPQVSHEDRLAELRRKSELSRQNAKAKAKPADVPSEVQPDTVAVSPVQETTIEPSIETDKVKIEPVASPVSQSEPKQGSINVFKTIQTDVAKPSGDRRRKRRRHDKKGGGRQKQEKKLNRQKYLEYKYAARDILDNPNIPEEHRSNILGQVWAKGERIGVSDCIEFIEQKVMEEILPEDAAQKLRDLVNKMTTRR
ncbi:MAG: hypothetical protein DWC04_05315 [Candidatus Poseidoniales archaeon]|nr:MAG: hypothetical protein DWC04_05315 [Candidatus Poseidoniales archaeon]